MSNVNDASNSRSAGKSNAIGPVTVALASVGAALAPAAEAATFTVTNTNDSGAGSLRQAIETANTDAAADTILFQSGLSGTITLTSGQLDISESVTITGPGAANLAVSGNNASRVFYIWSGEDSDVLDVEISGLTVTGGATVGSGGGIVNFYESLTLDSVIVSGNTASSRGGGIALFSLYEGDSVTIRNSTISNNSAEFGGGIYIGDTGAPLTIVDSSITGNTATRDGGGVYFYDPDDAVTIERTTISGNTAQGNLGRTPAGGTANGLGGGIYLYDTDGGPLRIADSTISGNSAGDGGGAYFFDPDNEFEFVNTTISGNLANGRGGGIAFYYAGDSDGRIAHSTITNNYASDGGGGIYAYDGILDITHSIVAGNDSDSGSRNFDGSGRFQTIFSIVGDVANPSVEDDGGNQFGVDPLLGALGNNGGPTETHLPQAGSPAIDTGDPAIVDPPALDQAGNPRVVNGTIDIGALEVQATVQQGPKVPVPALGLFGLAAAALGIGGVGAAAARRRKRNGSFLSALAVAVTLAAGMHAPIAEARARPATTRVATTLSGITVDGGSARVAMGSGQSIQIDATKLIIKDVPRGSTGARSPESIVAGQPAVVKTKFNADGSVREVRVRLFRTIEAAQRAANK